MTPGYGSVKHGYKALKGVALGPRTVNLLEIVDNLAVSSSNLVNFTKRLVHVSLSS